MMSLVTVFPVITAFQYWCDRQQLWKAVITGNTVTRLIIPIRGRSKNHLKKARGEIWPKRNERRNNTHKKRKKKPTKMRTRLESNNIHRK